MDVMIYEIDANLLEYNLDGIIHQTNCFHCQSGGIAARIKIKYPCAYEADLLTKRGDREKMGTFSLGINPTDNKFIYNMYSQYSFSMGSKHTSYDAMYDGLMLIEKHAGQNLIQRIGLPKNMGSVLGGGKWSIVRSIIDEVFKSSNVDLYICNYEG